MRNLRNILLLSYPLLLGVLAILLFREGCTQPQEESLVSGRNYKSNPHWMEQTEFYSLYESPPKVVFLGTSLTARINWSEALGRCDAAGRGVNGDITAGILARVPMIAAQHPAVCFVEGGINDLDLGLPAEEIAANLIAAAQQLRTAGVRPVLTALFPVGAQYPQSRAMNARIDSVNARLAALAGGSGAELLDIHALLSGAGSLRPEFGRADGLHLTAAAYRIWAGAARQYLQQRGL